MLANVYKCVWVCYYLHSLLVRANFSLSSAAAGGVCLAQAASYWSSTRSIEVKVLAKWESFCLCVGSTCASASANVCLCLRAAAGAAVANCALRMFILANSEHNSQIETNLCRARERREAEGKVEKVKDDDEWHSSLKLWLECVTFCALTSFSRASLLQASLSLYSSASCPAATNKPTNQH